MSTRKKGYRVYINAPSHKVGQVKNVAWADNWARRKGEPLNKRRIEGRPYVEYPRRTYSTKRDANRQANKARKAGYNARVIPTRTRGKYEAR
jgi:hypothetical protein